MDQNCHILTCVIFISEAMSNQELIQTGRRQMDETDQTIERSKKVAKSVPQDFEFFDYCWGNV